MREVLGNGEKEAAHSAGIGRPLGAGAGARDF